VEATAAFIDALRELGWVEGKNIAFERRYAENRLERLAEFAAELVHLNVDVIVAEGTLAPLAAKRATSTIPLVMTVAGDPLGSGLVESLARPGGNVTGMSLMAPDLGGKPLEVRGPDDFEGAFETARRQHSDALITVEDPLTGANRERIAHFTAVDRLPSLHGYREDVLAGGLISYGANFIELFRRAAGYVDKVLKGVKPADLPVQQPTKFELVINLKTAKAFGLQVPPSLLARADEVIE
jgi:putative ABC transport system substrate-binding protein